MDKSVIKRFSASNVIFSLAMVLLLISAAVTLTLNFRPLYYFDIEHLHIPESSGYSEEEIRGNFDALIDYNSVFNKDRLSFPSMAMSETGEIHFEEVKNIFSALQITAMSLSLPVLGVLVWKLKTKDYFALKLSGALAVILPAVLGLLIMLNWDGFFVLFHKIFFNNDYWIFDSRTDPVISILPDMYFLHCAVMILLLVVLTAVILWTAGTVLGRAREGN